MKKRKCWHEAPMLKNGDMCSYPEWSSEMRPSEPFDSTLRFVSIARGRSSAIAQFFTDDGRLVPMFMTHFQEVVPLLVGGKIFGRWVIAKRGENYGVALEEEPPDA